jgi:general stress protein 26
MSTVLEQKQAPADERAKIEKLRSLIEKIRFCMMTSIADDETLHSRPMSFLEWPDDGPLLFFTSATSTKMRQLKNQRSVDLSFCEPCQNVFVSVSGEAKVLHNQALVERLFSPIMRNWFPDGPTDPNLRLLSISPITGEYWDGFGLSLLLSLRKGKLTDKSQKLDGHEYFEL